MTRVDEFNSFYGSTFAQAVQVTYAVCGDRQVAFESTVDAYRRAWRDWTKIRDRHPLGYVRNEAWKLTALSRGTHPLRRRHEEDGDTALLDALGELSIDDRRLIVLMTLGNTDLEEASREVGVPAEVGIESVTTALSTLETSLGQSLDEIERRMHDLARATDTLERPSSADVRTAARRGRQRNTVALVVMAVVLALGGGFLSTDDDALESRAALPYREKIGAERPDVVLDAQQLDTDNLLTTAQVTQLDPARTWSITDTDEDIENTTPYATCPTQRFADEDPLKVFVRTYQTDGPDNERVAQAIEVSDSAEKAEQTYSQLLQWYSDCEHPRVQLVSSYTVERPFGDFRILLLRSNREPERTFTVGFSQSGTVTSTLVHETDGTESPPVEAFARTLNDSVARICADSGGDCADAITLNRTEPPPTTMAPSFLGIVDLPPIAQIDRVWAGIEPFVPTEERNPTATPCDGADFTDDSVDSALSRIFVIPGAGELPPEFGVSETVARFGSDEEAEEFVDGIRQRVEDCPDDNLSAEIDQDSDFETDAYSGDVWRISVEVDEDTRAYYRTGLVRRGSDVAQVTFTPAGEYDVSKGVFQDIVQRAGSRLLYAGD